MSYNCGTAASLVIAGVVAYLDKKIPNGIEVNTTDRCINIYPRRFKQLEKALEYSMCHCLTSHSRMAL